MTDHKMRRDAATAIAAILEDEIAGGRGTSAAFRDQLVVTAAAVLVTGIAATGILVSTARASAPQASAPDHSSSPLEPGGPGLVFVDGPTYGSIAELARKAEVVVEGRFGAKIADQSEGDLNDSGIDGLDFEVWAFTPDQVISGSVGQFTINVSQVAVPVEGAARPAEEGRRAILFLTRYPGGDFAIVGLGVGALVIGPDGRVSALPEASPELAAQVSTLTDGQVISAIRSQFG